MEFFHFPWSTSEEVGLDVGAWANWREIEAPYEFNVHADLSLSGGSILTLLRASVIQLLLIRQVEISTNLKNWEVHKKHLIHWWESPHRSAIWFYALHKVARTSTNLIGYAKA